MKQNLSLFKTTIFSFLFLLIATAGWAQTTIFSENMGGGSGTLSIAANTFQNSGTLTYTGSADTRITTSSTGYSEASGGRNVYFTNANGTNFQIAGINTSSYTSLSLSFGINKSTIVSGSDFKVEVSSDGTNYTTLSFLALPDGAKWYHLTASGIIPSTANLRIRFTQTGTATQYRIDDVKLTGIPVAVAPPVVSAGAVTGTVGAAITNYQIVATNSPTSYAITSGTLPAGLALNTTTGVISGTPTSVGGSFIDVTATNDKGVSSPATISFTVKANQTITFAPLSNMQYGAGTFGLTGTASSSLAVSYTSSNPTVATVSGNEVTVVGAGTTNITASQGGNGNYNAANDVVRPLTVTTLPLMISGVTANNKIQDGTTTATLSGIPVLVGLKNIDQETVTVSGTPIANFASANVGTAIAVTVTGYTLSGPGAGNYTVTQPANLKANITSLIATSATNITGTSFDANWNTGATVSSGYLLDVSTSETFGTTATLTLTEGFDKANTEPTGWTFTGLGTPYTSAGNFGVSSPSLRFDNTGSQVVTSVLSGNATELKFWLKAQVTNPESAFLVEGYNGVSWITVQNITNISGSKTYTYNSASLPALPANITKFRFTYTKLGGNLSFDDVEINYVHLTPSLVSGYDPKIISDGSTMTTAVTGLSQDTQYYYRLRAKNGSVISVNSNTIAVKTLLITNDTTYNGTIDGWDNGEPTVNLNAVINGDLTLDKRLVAKTLTINSGKTLTIAGGTSFTTGDFINNGNLIVANDGNFVQTVGSTNTGSGNATVKRIANMKRLDYTFWGSPVKEQKLLAFSPQTLLSRFLIYNTETNDFDKVENPAETPFATAKGYAIRANNYYPVWTVIEDAVYTDFEGVFTGVPNNGNVSIPLELIGQQYNLIGNPYPSNIDFNALVASGAIAGTAYLWANVNPNPPAQSGSYEGNNYATLSNATGGAPALNGVLKHTPTRYIKVGQGFVVQAKTGTLTFTNEMRNDGTGTSRFISRGYSDELDRFWIKLTTPAKNFNTILIAYVEGATNGFDPDIDAQQMADSSDTFYSIVDDKKLNIQGRAFPLLDTDVVPLGMKGFEAGTYSIAMVEKEGVFANGQDIYLKDKENGRITNISQASYSFVANKGVTDGRFEIIYVGTSVLGTGNSLKEGLVVYRDGNDFVLKSDKNISDVEVYDASGRLITKLNPNQKESRLDGSRWLNGIYVLKITSASNNSQKGSVVTKKVVK